MFSEYFNPATNNNLHVLPDPWLASILHKPVYKFVIDEDFIRKLCQNRSNEQILLQDLQAKPCFMYTKVPVRAIALVAGVTSWQFQLVDTNVTLEKHISKAWDSQKGRKVRFALPEDENRTVDLGKKTFVFSRFHLDDAFSTETANHIKAEWVRNYFLEKRGEYMVVALDNEKIIGFLQLLQNKGVLTIDLIAVDPEYQGQGVGRNMIMFAEKHCQGNHLIQVGTQIANTPSICFYENLGFRMKQAQYVFHFHKN